MRTESTPGARGPVFCGVDTDSLAFTDPDLIDRGKIAILMGSLAAAVVGCLLILAFSKKSTKP